MAMGFTARLSWWISRGKQKDPIIYNGPSINSPPDSAKRNVAVASSSSRNTKRKWRSREERKIDKDYDIVLVPPDGGCISGSESDGSDWSVGWLEPHGPSFHDESLDDSFAVLVPCYGRRGRADSLEDSKNEILDGDKYMEQWLSSL